MVPNFGMRKEPPRRVNVGEIVGDRNFYHKISRFFNVITRLYGVGSDAGFEHSLGGGRPAAATIDCQSVKNAEKGGAGSIRRARWRQEDQRQEVAPPRRNVAPTLFLGR